MGFIIEGLINLGIPCPAQATLTLGSRGVIFEGMSPQPNPAVWVAEIVIWWGLAPQRPPVQRPH